MRVWILPFYICVESKETYKKCVFSNIKKKEVKYTILSLIYTLFLNLYLISFYILSRWYILNTIIFKY